jgi:hypothetical protein
MRKTVAVMCVLLVGCSAPQPWVKVNSASKMSSSKDSMDLKQTLDDCAVAAFEAHKEYKDDVDALFNSHSTHANFQNCMRDKGYIKGS